MRLQRDLRRGLALEHNGDLYSCDHFVEPKRLLGNIRNKHMIELVASPRQLKFGRDKRDSLPRCCLECDVRFACHGECPKNRFIVTPDGEPGLNYLCAGFKEFFHHAGFPMKLMAGLMRRGRGAGEVMPVLHRAFDGVRGHDPCPAAAASRSRAVTDGRRPDPARGPCPSRRRDPLSRGRDRPAHRRARESDARGGKPNLCGGDGKSSETRAAMTSPRPSASPPTTATAL